MPAYIRLFNILLLCTLCHASFAAKGGFTDRIIVKMKEQQTEELKSVRSSVSSALALSNHQLNALTASAGRSLIYSHTLKNTASFVMKLNGFTPLQEVQQLAEKLMADDPSVEYAEPDYVMYPTMVEPNDTFYQGYQWHLQSSAQQGLNLPQAWAHTTGSSEVVVAVVDTGVLFNHEDFEASRILPGFDFVSEDESGVFISANDGDGRDNDATDPGDWVTEAESLDPDSPMFECNVEDSSWHGTHVAGSIAAYSNNNLGVSGVDWAAKILPVRAIGKCGGYNSDIADAIIWAAGGLVDGVDVNAHPADIINLSLGNDVMCSSTMQSALNLAFNAGATIVVAAGNESTNTAFSSPASCDNVIVVGAHNQLGQLSDFSNYGDEIDLLAPGGNESGGSNDCISSLSNTGKQGPKVDKYRCDVGSSMAAPHISGLVALMLSRNPKLSPVQIETLLKGSTRGFASDAGCFETNCGAGIADAHAVISASAIPYAPSGLIVQSNHENTELTWTDNSVLETGFNIEHAINEGDFSILASVAKNITNYTHSNTTVGVTHHYRIAAINGIFSTGLPVPNAEPSSASSESSAALSNFFVTLLMGIALFRRRLS